MPKRLDEISASPLLKLILVGVPGAGKTGALAALANAGFKLRILDYDGNLAPLLQYVEDKYKPNVESHGLTEKSMFKPDLTVKPGMKPKAFMNGMKALDNWNWDEPDAEKMPISDFGPDHVVVLDSISLFGKAVLKHVLASEGRLGKAPQIQDWGAAGNWLESFISGLISEDTQCHVICLTHLTAIEMENGANMFFPKALSKSSDTEIGKYFDTMLMMESKGSGSKAVRQIRTVPTTMFPTKAPIKVAETLPVETGLADYFRAAGVVMPDIGKATK